jgi:hypothetical protein
MFVELREMELELIELVCEKRKEFNEKVGTNPTPYGAKRTLDQYNLDSYAGEIAFCKIMGVYPDFGTDHYEYYDCTLLDGRKVDVKTTYVGSRLYPNKAPHLIVKEVKDKEVPDLYALMVGVMDDWRNKANWPIRFEFKGWMAAAALRQEKYWHPEMKGPGWRYPGNQLRMEDWF